MSAARRGRPNLPALISRTVPNLRALSVFELLFAVYLAAALLIFAFLVPPFQKNDEPAHFHRTVSITNLDLFCAKDENGEYYFEMKRKFAELPDVLHTFDVAFRYDSKFDRSWLHASFSDPKYNEPARVYRFCALPVPGYFPNAVGVLLGKPFQNPLVSFYLGRLTGGMFFVVALIVSLRVIPERYRPALFFYAALPTVLNQVTALSYDAAQLSLFPLILAYAARFCVDDRRLTIRDLVVYMLLLWWMINIRIVAYFPLLLLFLLLKPSMIADRFSRYALIATSYLSAATLSTAVFTAIYLPRATDSVPDAGIDSHAQLRFVLHHPISFLDTSYETLRLYGEGLMRETIGVFGWVDHTLGWGPYYIAWFIAGIVFYRLAERDVRVLDGWRILVLFAAIALTVGGLLFSLYAVWTPVGFKIVWGLQGRYFIGLLPLLMFLVSQTAVAVGRGRLAAICLAIAAAIVLYNVYRAVDLRYYGPPRQPPASLGRMLDVEDDRL